MTPPRAIRWHSRCFRAWLRFMPTDLGREAEEDIVAFFEERLEHEGRSALGRMALLARAMVDAARNGRSLGWTAPHRSPAHAPSRGPTLRGAISATGRDLRFALRSLRRRPMFSGISVLALGLGIGGTTAMFTVVDGVLLKQREYDDPQSVVSVWKAWPSWRGAEGLDYTWEHIQFPWVDYLNVKEHARVFSAVAAHAQTSTVLTGIGPAEELSAGEASGNLFEMLGVTLPVGRSFRPEETAPAGAPARVVMLSHQLWDRRFGRDPSVLGTSIRLNGEPFEIIGILPERFRLESDLISTHQNGGGVDPGLRDVWLPLGTARTDRGNAFELIARLADGRTLPQARAEVQSLLTDGPSEQIARVETRRAVVTQGFHAPLVMLLAASALLMVIACANVMGLLLGEAPGRRREIAVRSALGAHRGRILRQLVTENVLLGLAGALLGVGIAWLGVDALLAIGPALPRVEQVSIDWRVLAFAGSAGIGTGLIFGVLPAVHLSRTSVAQRMRARALDGHTRRLQAAVVAGQIALTMVLLVSASLFGRSLLRLSAVEPGFEPDGAHAISIGVPPGSSTDQGATHRFGEELLRVARSVPGVSGASLANRLPFAGSNGTQGFRFLRSGEPRESTQLPMVVHPSYFETLGIPLLEGRTFTASDTEDSPRVMIVSRAWAEKYSEGTSPLGIRVRYRGPEYDWTIVGLVDDVRHQALGVEPGPTFYTSSVQRPLFEHMLIVRTEAQLGDVFTALRTALIGAYPDLPIADAGPLPELIRASEADDRFRAILLGTFAALATVLAMIGTFGVTARAVSARNREIGIRAALGARAAGLQLLVLRESLTSALIGVALGVLAAAAVAGAVAPLLYEVRRYDPVAFGGATVLALVICGAAAYLPARRVTMIDPARVVAEE